jgi:uncharacterized protein YktA (UPF0223 family)
VRQQETVQSTETAQAIISEKTEAETNRNEKQSGGSMQLSPPDSTGKQHPIFINWYNNEIVETSKIRAEIEAVFNQKIETLEQKITELEQQIEKKTEQKQLSKWQEWQIKGFRICFLLIFLIGIYAAFKGYLKLKK